MSGALPNELPHGVDFNLPSFARSISLANSSSYVCPVLTFVAISVCSSGATYFWDAAPSPPSAPSSPSAGCFLLFFFFFPMV